MSQTSELETEPLRQGLLLELGRRIVRLRMERGWSQGELARRLGMSASRLGKWERGLHGPQVGDLAGLADVLEVDLEELVRGREPAERASLSPGQWLELKACWANLMRLLQPLMERPRAGRRGSETKRVRKPFRRHGGAGCNEGGGRWTRP